MYRTFKIIKKQIYSILFVFALLSFAGCSNKSKKIDNVATFAKVYGYVRWFHPSDEAQTIDWNKFAVYGASKVKDAKSPEALRDSLLKLFKPIAPTINISIGSVFSEFDAATLIPPDTNINKCIAWQHLGVGSINPNSHIYKSERTNRIKINVLDRDYQFFYLVESDLLKHKNVRLSFDSKCSSGGKLNVFLTAAHVDVISKMPEITNSIVYSNTFWKTNQISTYAGDNESLYFGVFNSSNAEVFVDNFLLEVQTDKGWVKVKIKNTNLNIPIVNNSPENFFARNNSFYKVSSVNRNSGLNNYCVSIKPNDKNTLFDMHPIVGEVVIKDLPRGLKLSMPIALYGDNESTYPIADKTMLQELKKSLSQSFTKQDEELGAIVITWNVFQHFYPYFNEVKVDWNNELTNTLDEVLKLNNNDSFEKILRRFTAKLNDGHIRIGSENYSIYTDYLPLSWEWIENKLVVTSVQDKKSKIKVGDIITHINGDDAKSYFKDVEQYISASTPGYLRSISQLLSLKRPYNSQTTLTVINKQGDKLKIKVANTSNVNKVLNSKTIKTKFSLLNDSIYYVNLSQINMQEFNSLLPELEYCKGIIFDLRVYPINNHFVLSHLIETDDTVSNCMQIPKFIYPDQKNILGYVKTGFNLKPKQPHLSAPVVFLTNSSAISTCESYLSIVSHYKLGVIVGENSAGTNGNVNHFTLPGDYRIQFTGMKVTKLDGSQFHGVGIAPDYTVHKTIKGVREGRDEFLEKAIELINR